MADTTKLASTFEAWRLTFVVGPKFLEAAMDRCQGLGVEPRVIGSQLRGDASIGILLSVVVPKSACREPNTGFAAPYMSLYGAALTHSTEVRLVCPLPEASDPRLQPLYKAFIKQLKYTADGAPIVAGMTVWNCQERCVVESWTVHEIRTTGVGVLARGLSHHIDYADVFSTLEAALAEARKRNAANP